MTTVYVSIGNSDDKLQQGEWSAFYGDVDQAIRKSDCVGAIHGAWISESRAPWQNACWAFDLFAAPTNLRAELRALAHAYRQDSIAWATAETEFLSGA